MRPAEIIKKKRDGGALTPDEIHFFVRGVTTGEFADYQATALLMAVLWRGMDEEEQRALTEAMLHSGQVLDFAEIALPKADKHSTGGVGDKTSLIIAPLAAACGLCVPMISGRGLDHTGGTLDKLEAIPGYRVNLPLEEFRRVLHQIGFAMTGQTGEIAPADKKLYALRDATATVEAIPLIVASIMSKKLAAGLGALVLDVKTGTGAFMREETRARALAGALVKTGNACGVKTEALITDMNQPLGRAVGNANEVAECLQLLRGETSDARVLPVLELSIELTARMIRLSGLEPNDETARARALRAIESGAALECFRRNVAAQGGDPRVCDDAALLYTSARREVKVESPRAGYVTQVNAAEIGHAVAVLGGGRTQVEDVIDPLVGFFVEARHGDKVKAGDLLGLVRCREGDQRADGAVARIRAAYVITESPPVEPLKLIKDTVAANDADGNRKGE